MKIYVISGGPGTGKTSTIEDLKFRGYDVLKESARFLSKTDKKLMGKSTREINHKYFQKKIFELQKKNLEKIKKKYKQRNKEKIIFTDRGLGDTIAYYKIRKIDLIPKEIIEYAKNIQYTGIFILGPLDFYKTDKLRQETREEQKRAHKIIIDSYKKLGYNPVIVPFMSVKKRSDFILKNIRQKSQ